MSLSVLTASTVLKYKITQFERPVNLLLMHWLVQLLQEESTIMMHALILHTPTQSNISSVSFTRLSHSLPHSLAPSVVFLSILSACLRRSLSLLHAESVEVSEMQSQLTFVHPHTGSMLSMICRCTCITRKKIGNKCSTQTSHSQPRISH